MAPSLNVDVVSELRNITTVNLIANATSIIEKILWALIAICGTLFIYDVVYVQLENWRDNPTLITMEMKDLSEMPLPSMTFCHKGLQKYGPVERLANIIDSNKEIPKQVLAIRNEFFKVQFQKMIDVWNGIDYCEWLFNLKKEQKEDHPIHSRISADQIDSLKVACNVSLAKYMFMLIYIQFISKFICIHCRILAF